MNKYDFHSDKLIGEMKRQIELTITERDGTKHTFNGYGQTKSQSRLSAAKRAMAFKTRQAKIASSSSSSDPQSASSPKSSESSGTDSDN